MLFFYFYQVYHFKWNFKQGVKKDKISCTCVQRATFIDRSDRMAILFFRSARNNQPGRGCLDLAPPQVSLNSVGWLLRRSENVSASQRPRRPSCFPIGPRTRTWERMLRSFFLSNFDEFCSAVSEEKSKMPQPIRGQGGHRLFRISSKNTNLVEAVEILLPVNFR